MQKGGSNPQPPANYTLIRSKPTTSQELLNVVAVCHINNEQVYNLNTYNNKLSNLLNG